MIEVVFAPDWREGVPYQRLLADALAEHDVRVNFLQDYKRVFPLRRLMRNRSCDVLHLHWPEAYYPAKGDVWDWFRRARFAFDLAGAVRHCALAATAHNLHAHNRAGESFAVANMRAAYCSAAVVFAHSEIAKSRLIDSFHLPPERIRVIPHGDLSVTLGTPLRQADARRALGLGDGKVALVFGAIEPYKGQEEIIAWWKEARPDVDLAIIGKPISPEYQAQIEAMTSGAPRIHARFGWLADDQLRLWLCAADVVVFNYRQIFTSGAAHLARSWGIPILLPARLDTIVLDEPSPFVLRFHGFESDFAGCLTRALLVAPDFGAAAAWRHAHTWDKVARLTAEGYHEVLRRRRGGTQPA
jgi:glycosyltransferase involved in cell wall biosynthesis